MTASVRRAETFRLGLLFGLLYFAQGIAEPTEGLIAQPVRSMLSDWQFSPTAIGAFAWAISLPWWLKPVYGYLSDFVPLAGFRRKSYLLLATAAASISLLLLFWWPVPAGSLTGLLVWLLIPTLGVAVADVALDGWMVERGQPLGITGTLQSVQWTALYAATILTGSLGGWLSQYNLQPWGFLICGVALAPTAALAIWVDERPCEPSTRGEGGQLSRLVHDLRSPPLLAMCGFLLLWNVNPFASTVLQIYLTSELGLGEQFYGDTVSLQAIAAVVASSTYGLYCRRVPLRGLLHGSILCGILATICYGGLADRTTAVAISLFAGFIYMTGSLIQMDLAARSCPARMAATVFSLLMALSNVGISLSQLLGGYCYEQLTVWWGPHVAFRLLVSIGAATTAACWLLTPWLLRLTPTPSASSP
ncbi:MAG: MFS transporter [Pirellulaceae bacterium]